MSSNLTWHAGEIDPDDRPFRGATVWFTGLSGSGKSTVAARVERLLVELGRPAYVLDGDNVRHGLNADLGFSDDDRRENVRRIGEVARLMADAGIVALVPVISPFREGRDAIRGLHAVANVRFLEVFVDTPMDECERRDPKGLYAKARRGELAGFTGIDSPYEPPVAADLVLRPGDGDADAQARRVLVALEASASPKGESASR